MKKYTRKKFDNFWRIPFDISSIYTLTDPLEVLVVIRPVFDLRLLSAYTHRLVKVYLLTCLRIITYN